MSIYTKKEFKVILAIALIITFVLILAALRSCSEVSSPEGQSRTALSPAAGQKASALPDIQILQANPYGIPPLATQFRFISDTQVTVNCPLALFGGGFIASNDQVRMVNFLEVKSMKVDTNGNELAFSELYKPGSPNEAGYYVFDPDCIPTLPCSPLAHDTLRPNQWDMYLVNYVLFGAGITVHEATPNSLSLWAECPGCSGDHYFFALRTTVDSLGWHTERYDQALTNAVKAKLKNHK